MGLRKSLVEAEARVDAARAKIQIATRLDQEINQINQIADNLYNDMFATTTATATAATTLASSSASPTTTTTTAEKTIALSVLQQIDVANEEAYGKNPAQTGGDNNSSLLCVPSFRSASPSSTARAQNATKYLRAREATVTRTVAKGAFKHAIKSISNSIYMFFNFSTKSKKQQTKKQKIPKKNEI